MSTVVTVDEQMLRKAAEASGVSDPNELVSLALKSLIAHEAALHLARMGGIAPDLEVPGQRGD